MPSYTLGEAEIRDKQEAEFPVLKEYREMDNRIEAMLKRRGWIYHAEYRKQPEGPSKKVMVWTRSAWYGDTVKREMFEGEWEYGCVNYASDHRIMNHNGPVVHVQPSGADGKEAWLCYDSLEKVTTSGGFVPV